MRLGGAKVKVNKIFSNFYVNNQLFTNRVNQFSFLGPLFQIYALVN